MKKQFLSFLLLLITAFFWFSVMGAVVMGLHFIFTFDAFSGVAFLVFGVISLIYIVVLKKFPKLKEVHSTFLDLLPPFG